MSAQISGKQIVWGVPAGAITGVHSVTTSGIVQSFGVQFGGETEVITDEDGDKVTRVDHGAENKLSMEVICEPSTTMPEKGDELTGLGTIDGVDFTTGRVFVDDANAEYTGNASKKISISATHYPGMPADA